MPSRPSRGKCAAEGAWDNPDAAKKIVLRVKAIKAQTDGLTSVIRDFEDSKLAYEMARESNDKDLLVEADEMFFNLLPRMEKFELQSLLSGPHDAKNCFLTISAGQGGTEANDWAEMLFRMYIFYCCRKMNFDIEEVERGFGSENQESSSVTLYVKAPFAFGYLKCERGTHRLARVSPYNAQGKRQTSFATVDVAPEFDDIDVTIPENELEVTPFVRTTGPGGQNVNKVASAIRLVHKPTGIMVVTSTYRDQPQNKNRLCKCSRPNCNFLPRKNANRKSLRQPAAQ